MAPLKQKGDLAELMVAADLRRRGYVIAIPFGEDCNYDLVLDRGYGPLERVQVKYCASDGAVVVIRCRSHSLTHGRVRTTKHYTSEMIEWLAAFDPTTERIFYVPAQQLGVGRWELRLRLTPARNGQHVGIRSCEDFVDI